MEGVTATDLRVLERARLAPFRSRLATAFFFSGFAGLVYQVVWTRILLLGFGVTTEAVATVVAAFMAGLALGSFGGGRIADRLPAQRAFRLYALLEVGVAALCLLTPLVLGSFPDVFAAIERTLGANRVVRALVAGAILLPPTALMGATLPILVRAWSAREPELGRTVGWLYGINTVGAVAGAFVSGFLLIATLGIHGTVFLAAAFNVVAAALVWRLASRLPAAGEAAPEPEGPVAAADEASGPPPPDSLSRALLVASAAVSGAVALGLEVLWTRTIILTVGSSTQAVALMLTTFLAGIALGASIYARFASRLRSPAHFAALLQFTIAVASVLLLRIAGELPLLYLALWEDIGRSSAGLVLLRFLPAFVLMLGPTLLMGANLPALISTYGAGRASVGREVGSLYAANTAGAIAGPLLVGLALLPAVGVDTSAAVIAGFGLAGGAAALLADLGALGRRTLLYVAFPVVIAIAIALMPAWDPLLMGRGLVYKPNAVMQLQYAGQFDEMMERSTVLYYRDAPEATVLVFDTGHENRIFVVNGRPEASTDPADMRNQYLLGHLPALLHRGPVYRGLVIALGSGMTAGCLALHAEHVRVVELVADVVGAAALFAEWNYDAVADPRVEITIDDGRHFLLATDERFDVITVDPIHPSVAGSESLYSQDHYRLVAARLAPGGVAAQWLPLYQMGVEDARTIVATFASVFPDAQIWLNGMDAVLIGGAGAELRPAHEIRDLMALPEIARSLERVHQRDFATFLAGYGLGPPDLQRYIEGAPVSTDARPIIEFSLAWQIYQGTQDANLLEILRYGATGIVTSFDGLTTSEREAFERARQAVHMDVVALALREAKHHKRAFRLFQRVLALNPHDPIARVALRM